MKKVKWIVVIMAALLCFTCLFTACKKEESPNEDMEPDTIFTEKGYTGRSLNLFTSATALTAYNGFTLSETCAQLVLLTATDENAMTTYSVYDLAEEREVGKYTDTETTRYTVLLRRNDEVANGAFYIVAAMKINENEEEETVTYDIEARLVDAKGQEASVVRSQVNDPSEAMAQLAERFETYDNTDLIRFGEDLFVVGNGGTLTRAGWYNELMGDVPEVDVTFGTHYYDLSDKRVVVYDKQCKTVAFYGIPSYAVDYMAEIMDSGDVFVQYYVKKSVTDTDYDIASSDLGGMNAQNEPARYSLLQKIVRTDGTVQDVSLGYFVVGFAGRNVENVDGFNTKYRNFAVGYEIKDKQIDASIGGLRYIAVTNDGAVQGVLSEPFMPNALAAEPVALDRVIVTDASERVYLCKFDGTRIGEVTNARKFLPSYIVGQKAIYDYNLQKICDFTAEGYSYVACLADSVILSKTNEGGDVETYLFAGNAPVRVAETRSVEYSSGKEYYEVKTFDEENELVASELYNYKGTKIATFGNEIIRSYVWGSALMVSATGEEGTMQYYFVK